MKSKIIQISCSPNIQYRDKFNCTRSIYEIYALCEDGSVLTHTKERSYDNDDGTTYECRTSWKELEPKTKE